MKKIVIYITILVMLGYISSCSEEDINMVPKNYMQINYILEDSAKIVAFVNNIYSNLPTGYNRLSGNSMVGASIDEAVHTPRGSAAEKWGTGNWGPATQYDDAFASSYAAIRKTFIFGERIRPNIPDYVMTPASVDKVYGEVLFLRALFNFEILKRYGGYPIIKRVLYSSEDLSLPRDSYDDCVSYISSLCDSAATLLPYSYGTTQLGRATKGAALALKARLLLYAASPLFNDPQNPTGTVERGAYDPNKWELAAAAAAEVINLKENGSPVYSLYSTYNKFFNFLNGNKEIILSKMAPSDNNLEKINGPVSITGGGGGTNPSLDLVNAYEMKTGIPFDWNNPVHAANPFANRDPRFDMSILYNGATWMNNMKIETFVGGKDAIGSNATRTSFYLRKFLSDAARWNPPVGTTYHCFPLFRYAEILLNYGEAMNEAYGPDVDPKGYGMTARQAIKLIRQRAGLTGNVDLLGTVPNNDKNKMREAIRHERQIELAFEEHRHLDLRRWKIAEQVLNQPVHGLNIIKNQNGTYTYQVVEVENRVFQPKMYLYPLPQLQIGRDPKLIQNTGWK